MRGQDNRMGRMRPSCMLGPTDPPCCNRGYHSAVQKPAPKTLGSVTLTAGFRVSVSPRYLPDHSDPAASRYVFAYRIRIANGSKTAATLLRRRWLITDGAGAVHAVEGDGVVGQQPTLSPGQVHEYSSFCPLATPWGTMEGAFTMARIGADGQPGDEFKIEVGRFYLFMPDTER